MCIEACKTISCKITAMVENLARISLTCKNLASVDYARYLQEHARKWPYSMFIQEFVGNLARVSLANLHASACNFLLLFLNIFVDTQGYTNSIYS